MGILGFTGILDLYKYMLIIFSKYKPTTSYVFDNIIFQEMLDYILDTSIK